MKIQDAVNPFTDAPVYYREVTGSTMEDSKNAAAEGILHGTVFMAGFQEKGRGRIAGRKWLSEKGENLLFTLVLRRTELVHELNHMPLLAGAALLSAVEIMAGTGKSENFRLKWPNDLLYNGRKCSGILSEADSEYFYCGMGVNCNQRKFPGDLEGRGISLSQISGREIAPLELLILVLKQFRRYLDGGELWRDKLMEKLFLYGAPVEVLTGRPGDEKRLSGINMGIGRDGQLLVKGSDGSIKEVYAGEIEII